jgi:hypothetical protein
MYVLYYVLTLRCCHLVWIQIRTNHLCLGVRRHNFSPTIANEAVRKNQASVDNRLLGILDP